MVELHTDVVSGVRTFWVDSGRPTLAASLLFRRGIVDETLATTGLTHLLEHLALHDRAKGALQVNGSVSLLQTQFDAHGPHEAVVAHLRELTSWLSAPQVADVAREASVLRAEAARQGASDVRAAMLNRYGARGPGLAGYGEPGLARVTAEAVTDLAAEWFTAGNAVLFLDGPPPADLAFHLNDGPLHEVPTAQAFEEPDELPKVYVTRQGVTSSGVVRRSTPATFLGASLQKLFHDDFRVRDGAAYAPWSVYEAVDADSAVVLAGSDVSPQLLPHVVDRTLQILTRATTSEVLDEIVPDLVAQARQSQADPYNAPMLAYRAAVDHLRGRAAQSRGDVAAELDEVTAETVRAVAEEMRSTLLLGVDSEAAWADQMPRLEMATRSQGLRGSTYRSQNYPADRDRLVVAPEGIVVGRGDEWCGVDRDEIEAVFQYPDGAREVIGADGWSVRVEPTLWRGGEAAAREAEALVEPDRRLVVPSREPERVPRPLGAWETTKTVWRQLRENVRFMVALNVVFAVLAIWLLVAGVVVGAAIMAFFAARNLKEIWQVTQASKAASVTA
ncbi:hypothetical protein N802_16955 [Knoellia sinensis KCTC 19936]|uniref:Peptidase M16 n=1 Tax=Knoellia sinensis KCTC 19936 TaxID=1385520 RepID=A0A0A0J9G7_9MICO|nr:insulinase family protein [Knoellia sinensis]KGN32682.1 hypothetical protein N802_16955 [Knoellia sinensis KCTC 19936]